MLQKKICLLGSFAVGKTSLIQRYVSSLFDDKYLTSVGVKIDKKSVEIDDRQLMLMIWDIAGKDAFTDIRPSHLRGMAGCIIAIDGTRQNSFDVALSLHKMVQSDIGNIPTVFALNKTDLEHQWVIGDEHQMILTGLGYPVLKTSAKTDMGVDDVFQSLSRQLVA